MEDDGDKGQGVLGWTGWGLGAVVLIYFGFPALWVWPIVQIYGKTSVPPDWVLWLVTPVAELAEHSPKYKEWVEWGLKLLGIS